MNGILFYISLALIVCSVAFFVYTLLKCVKDREDDSLNSETRIKLLSTLALFSIMFPLLFTGIAILNAYPMTSGEWALTLLFSFMFGTGVHLFTTSFVLYYYKTNLNKEAKKLARIFTFVAIPLMVIGFALMLEGIADHMYYPLINGICFTSEGIKFMTYADKHEGFCIAWYGIIILSGAVLVYLIGDHKFYKQFGKHGIIDTLFLVAFPAGLIGARLWFCFVLETEYFLANPLEVFAVWDGGMAIMGGAIFGIIAGLVFMAIFRKYISVRWALDTLVPLILIAQAIGRWGNFFNHEVYGALSDGKLNTIPVTMESWAFLPTWIRNQMAVSFTNGSPTNNMMYIPLFFIEFLSNLSGYFIIVYGIGKPLKKFLAPGSLAMLYISWYGATRVVLEPMRYNAANGFEYHNSYITAWAMVIAGFVGIGILYVVDFYVKKRKNKITEIEE